MATQRATIDRSSGAEARAIVGAGSTSEAIGARLADTGDLACDPDRDAPYGEQSA